MLEALHPGRVDLGIGRAPGTDQLTARALRRTNALFSEEEFPAQLVELLGYFTGDFPSGHPYAAVTATPGLGYQPVIWLLGSSDYSAQAAGMLGLPFSFAHHFAAQNTLAAVRVYRESFRPSVALEQPYVMLGVAVICAETEERAQWLAGPSRLAFLRLRSGRPGRYPTPEQAAAHEFTPMEQEIVRSWTASSVVGTPDTVRDALEGLATRTGADELMITTMVHGHEDRLRSYELVADALGIRSS
jgi:luciferase family oxidoreductase group 1